MGKRGTIRLQDVKILFSKSGNSCAYCKTPLAINDNNINCLIGEMAHIKGERPGSARFNHEMSELERNSYENLILLCCNCHKMIDENPSEFTVAKLNKIKSDHEKWVFNTLQSRLVMINFSELDVICKYLKDTPITDSEDLTVSPPHKKMDKNNLSVEVRNYIVAGLSQSTLVKNYLNKNPDIGFSDRLRAGFVNKYRELVASGFERDELFFEMFDFASRNSNEYRFRAAGLAVLTYFFEICEVFEK